MRYQVYVISAGRYDKLPFTQEQKSRYIFCVKNGEGDLYKKCGCLNVFETGRLVESRNFALRHAFNSGLICVQLSDDIRSVSINSNFGKGKVDIDYAISELVAKFEMIKNVYLMGVPPTSHTFIFKKIVAKNCFCIGDLFFVKPCSVYFDENLTLKEDYDYTLQHIKRYGACFRYQKYLFVFSHYKNNGGAVDYRTEIEEQKNIKYLLKKWGKKIKLSQTRKNEILI